MWYGAVSVGTRYVPRSIIISIASSSSQTPCSIELTPATTAFLMPSVDCACAATVRNAFFASSTPAVSSSRVKEGDRGFTPGVSTPPLANSLMASAPARISSRTALRTSSGPSASRAMKPCPCPPDIVTPIPTATTRGPSTSPSSVAFARSMLSRSAAPRSRTVVTPPASVARACSAVRQARRASDGALPRRQLRRFARGADVHVAVDQPGDEVLARAVDRLRPLRRLRLPQCGDVPVDAKDVAPHERARLALEERSPVQEQWPVLSRCQRLAFSLPPLVRGKRAAGSLSSAPPKEVPSWRR